MKNNNNRKPAQLNFIIAIFAGILLFSLGLFSGTVSNFLSGVDLNRDNYINSIFIDSLLEVIDREYLYDQGEINKQELTYLTAKGLVESLGDEYSTFYNPQEAEEYLNGYSTSYQGIGVRLGFDGQNTIIETAFEGSPGATSGLRADDVLIEVNEEDVSGLRPEEVAVKIRGEEGSVVKIKIFRPKDNTSINMDIIRQKIDIDNIYYEEVAEDIYRLKVVRFVEADKEGESGVDVFARIWDKNIDEIAKLSPKALIIDLRSNPGGYVSSVIHVAEEFLPTGSIIMKEKEKGEEDLVFTDSRKGDFEDIPLVVLVDSGSASASEIFSAAMQDNKRAIIIGEKTVGKGVEQKRINLTDGSVLMLVSKAWLRPNGEQISPDSPIIPDKLVEYSVEDNKDIQLQEAINHLR